jgi:hypothetical protein
MKQITREEFYRLLRETERDYELHVNGNSTEFRFKDDLKMFGEVIDSYKDGEEVSEYYINQTKQ